MAGGHGKVKEGEVSCGTEARMVGVEEWGSDRGVRVSFWKT